MKNLFTLVALGTITLLSTNIYSQCPGGNCGYPQNYDSRGYGGNYGGNQYQNQPSYQQRSQQNYQQKGYQQGYQQQQVYQQQQQNPQYANPQVNDNSHYQKSDEQKRIEQNNNDQNLNSDQVISKNVHDVLTSGCLSKGYQNVSYDVNNGSVTLRGTVESQDNKDSIDASIKKLEGVKQVNNEITVVKPAATPAPAVTAPAATTPVKTAPAAPAHSKNYSDAQLQDSEKKYPRDTAASPQDRQLNARIRDKLSLGWFSKGSETIVLRTQNGIVIITGFVEKPEDIQKVSDQVKAVDGVSTINNQLQAKPK